MEKPLNKPTPKSIIHQKFGNKACYTIEEVLEESPTIGCPGLAIPQKGPCLYRCHLQLPDFSVVSLPCKKKKEAEQSAAFLAIQKLGIDSQKSSLTESEAADELISRLSYIFSNEFLSSLHPLSNHLKAIAHREGELNGLVPVSVLFACDAKLGNLCRSINARVESNPFMSIPLIMRAAAKLSELLVVSEKDFWIRRKNPYPSDIVLALGNQQSGVNGALTEAVYIPYSLDTDVRPIKINLYVGAYYLDVIAKELDVVDASKVLISRTIGKASSESRLYFSALEAYNFDSASVYHNAKELSFSDSTFNIRASYLLGHHVYGNAILASTGYTWRGADLLNEDVSLRSYFRMFISKTPDELSKLYRDALLVADLPRQFTTKTNWRGSLPRDLLLAFCRQHRLSEPVFTVVCKYIEIDQDMSGSCQDLLDTMSSLGSTSKTASDVGKGIPNIVAKESYGCEIKVFSKNYNLILEHTPVEHFMKQGDAVQNATLKVLSFLNCYLKQPNMSVKELSSLSVEFDIRCHSTYFLKEFSVCQLKNKVQQSRYLLKEHNIEANRITYWTSLQKKELNIEGIARGPLPSNGFLVSISYSVSLVSEGEVVPEILEKNNDFEFEIGTGAVITCIEAAVLQMTAGQSVHFYMDMPKKELVLAAAMNCEKVILLLSSKPSCLEYSISLLRVTEPFEDRVEQGLFSPPLSKQRVEFALQYIKELCATSLIDFGCGSGSLLESLVDTPSSLEKIVGVDLSQKGLIRAAKVLNSKLEKLVAMVPKSKIRSLILYEGSITEFDSRLSGFDIGSCLEVIEHMEEHQAWLFGDIALGLFCPRVLIVSTPNYEYNVILQRSNLASQDEDPDEKAQPKLCKFRNHDHKFEWTREQFSHWATCLALKYDYSVEKMSTFVQANLLNPIKPLTQTRRNSAKLVRNSVRCESTTELVTTVNRQVKVSNGNDSLEINRVLNGMWQTSGGWGPIDRNDAVEAMLRYADSGLSTFDMADHYGPAEDLYGIFINRVRRERPPELLEKVRGLTKWVPPPVKMSRSFVEKSIDVSRKRMDVACLDMLQFHWWDYSNLGYLDALKHLTDLKDEGKIKTVALTNFDTERLQIILENGIPVVSNQVQHSIVDKRPQQRMAELCQQTGVKLITYGTVMGGLLSEKFLDTNLTIPFAGPSLKTPSLQKYKRMVDAWGGWSLFQTLLQVLNKVARKHGVSISTVAVRYILDQPAVAGSMIGVRLGLSEHIKDANAIFSLVLDEEDVDSISEVSNRGKDLMTVIGDCGDEYRRA